MTFETLAAAAATTATDVLAAIVAGAILLGWFASMLVSALKGKPWFAVLGFFWGVFAWVGAIRLAKPDSWWYRKRYGDDKRKRSFERFGGTGPNPLAHREAGITRPSLEG
jgi:hypothetical protein